MRRFERIYTPLRASTLLNGGIGLMATGIASTVASWLTGYLVLPFLVGVLAWAVATYNGAFHLHITRDELRQVPVVFGSSLLSLALVVAGSSVAGQSLPSASVLLVFGCASAISLFGGIIAGRWTLRYLWRRGEFRSTAVVVGSGRLSSELVVELRHRPELGIDVVDELKIGSFVDPFREEDIDLLEDSVRFHRPDRLLVGELDADDFDLMPTLRLAGQIGTRVYVLPRLFEMGIGNPLFAPDRLRGFPLLRVNRCAHPELAFVLKRLVDITVSALALTLLSPLLATVAVIVKVTSPGSVLFWQDRVGQDGRAIKIPKFRSMRHSDSSDTEWTADGRVTAIGRILRRSAIDEIPQLWSVLRGDMSLVGPRPERPAFVSTFREQYDGYDDRLRMRVGLTGLSQIAGLRGDTSIQERTKYDNLYIDQWSLSGDFIIMAKTVSALVRERSSMGAHNELEIALLELSAEEELNISVIETESTRESATSAS